ncbi:MAG: hypothetical protein MN733_36905 [Nitrososphaera sp.]|nr:hypothetical protein [Nitrososphaera sp.]
MILSEKDKEIVVKWIQEKCGQMRCTCCGLGQWTLTDAATLPIGFDIRTTRFYYHQGLPQVTVVCNHCGHMLFFSPGVMGIKPDEPRKEQVPVEPKVGA